MKKPTVIFLIIVLMLLAACSPNALPTNAPVAQAEEQVENEPPTENDPNIYLPVVETAKPTPKVTRPAATITLNTPGCLSIYGDIPGGTTDGTQIFPAVSISGTLTTGEAFELECVFVLETSKFETARVVEVNLEGTAHVDFTKPYTIDVKVIGYGESPWEITQTFWVGDFKIEDLFQYKGGQAGNLIVQFWIVPLGEQTG